MKIMTFTKDDVQAIRSAVREELSGTEKRLRDGIPGAVDAKVQASEKRIVLEMDKRFSAQSEFLSRTFKTLVEETYKNHPTREEFEEALERIDELEGRLKRLEQRAT